MSNKRKFVEYGVEELDEIYKPTERRAWDHGDNLTLLKSWARNGWTYQEMADRIGISLATLKNWMKIDPTIKNAILQSRELTNYKVENALLKAALGYTAKEVEVTLGKPDKEGNREIRRKEVTKTVGPNVTACMAWLNNKKPSEWRRNRDNFMELDDIDRNIRIEIYKSETGEEETEIED